MPRRTETGANLRPAPTVHEVRACLPPGNERPGRERPSASRRGVAGATHATANSGEASARSTLGTPQDDGGRGVRELNDGIADLVLFEPPGATLAPSLIALTDVGTKCSGEPPVADDDNPERMRPEASLCDRLRRQSRTSTSTSRWLQLETVLLLFATGQHLFALPRSR